MRQQAILGAIIPRLREVFGPRLQEVVLYGSTARGDERPDSDIDILVVLTGPVHLWSDLRTALLALYPLSLQWDRPISPKPVDVRDYREAKAPLYRHAQAEGISA